MNHAPRVILATGCLILFAVAFVSSTHGQGLAQTRRGQGGVAQKKPDYASFPQGNTILANGRTYIVLSDVRALPIESNVEPAGEILQLKGQFLIYRETRSEMKSLSAQSVQEVGMAGIAGQPVLSHAVVYNPHTHQIGVVMGSIVTHLANMTQAQEIAASHGLVLSAHYDQLGVAIYAVPAGEDVAAMSSALQADSRVASAEPEILEHERRPS